MPPAKKPAARSGRAAPRASKACDQCRAWRLRCDGQHPACARCRRRDQACSWSGIDRRRKSSDQMTDEGHAWSPFSLNVLADAASSSTSPLSAAAQGQGHTTVPPPPPPPPLLDKFDDISHPSTSSASSGFAQSTIDLQNPTWTKQDFDALMGSHPQNNDIHLSADSLLPRSLWWERDLWDGGSLQPASLGIDHDPSLLNVLDMSQIQSQHLSQEVIDNLTGRSAWIGGMQSRIEPQQQEDSRMVPSADETRPIEAPEKPVRLQYFRLMGPTAISSGIKLMSMDLHLTPSAQQALLRSTTPSNVRAGLRRLDWDRWRQLASTDSSPKAEGQETHAVGVGVSASDEATASTSALFDGAFPREDILDELIPLFFDRLGDHYPCIHAEIFQRRLRDTGSRNGMAMLVNAMCSLAARFSKHPEIATDKAQESIYTFGKVFADRSKDYLATSLSVPTKVTTLAFLLLAWHEFACNMDSAFWNYAGMALRMAIDLGLQHRLGRTDRNAIKDASDFIDDSLLFWSAYQMDRNLVMGTGRPTSIKDAEITLPLPVLDDSSTSASPVFALLIRHKKIGGQVAETLNAVISTDGNRSASNMYKDLNTLETELIASYENMPSALRMTAANLKLHIKQGQQHVFVEMHLWFHLLLFVLNRSPIAEHRGVLSPSDASSLVRKSVQRCAEIVALDDANDANILTCVPMANQTLFLAACAELDEISALKERLEGEGGKSPSCTSSSSKTINHLLRELIENYRHFSSVLQRMSVYFKGVCWIRGVLTEREKGIRDNDLVELAVGTDAFVSQQELRLLQSLHSDDTARTQSQPAIAPVEIKISDIPSLTELSSLFPDLA